MTPEIWQVCGKMTECFDVHNYALIKDKKEQTDADED